MVEEVSCFAIFTYSVYISITVWIFLLTLIVSVQEKSVFASCAYWHIISGNVLSNTVWFFQHTFSDRRNEIFLCTSITISIFIIFQTINIIFLAGLFSFKMISNLAYYTSVSIIFSAIWNSAVSVVFQYVRISASKTWIWLIDFRFFWLTKFHTIGNGAFSINFLEWSLTILTDVVLINTSWFSDN